MLTQKDNLDQFRTLTLARVKCIKGDENLIHAEGYLITSEKQSKSFFVYMDKNLNEMFVMHITNEEFMPVVIVKNSDDTLSEIERLNIIHETERIKNSATQIRFTKNTGVSKMIEELFGDKPKSVTINF